MMTSSWMCAGGDPGDLANGAARRRAAEVAGQQAQERHIGAAEWMTGCDAESALRAAVDAVDDLFADDAHDSAPTADGAATDSDAESGW